jgi:pyruvate dehydrogenase E2 component (dihydrolipoamide acetyltransferase)
MATPVRMPALGQTSDQLRLIAWLKAEGDTLHEGEPLFEAESDKAVHEVEASSDGTLLRLLGEIDEMIAVGTVIAWLGEPGEPIPDVAPAYVKAGAVSSPAASSPAVPSAVPASAAAAVAAAAPVPALAAPTADPAAGPVPATPVARRMAREHGVDLKTVIGSGPNGRIESRDVLAAAGETSSEAPAEPAGAEPAPGPAGSRDEPVPAHRQIIAQRLARSTAVPYFSVSRTIDARVAMARVAEAQGSTLTHVILQAMSAALDDFPRVNRVWLEHGPSFRQFTQANVGLAIASDDRLVIATISEAHRRPLEELALTVRETVQQGREGRLSGAASVPAPISLSNLGMYGVDHFEAIVDPDQTAIVAVGRIVERPAAIDGEVVVVPQLGLTLTVDHRTVDGAEAGSYLAAVCDHLEH